MNWIKKIARPLILIVLPAVIIACSVSYKFNGSSINYDKVKTISIADFPIKSEYVYAPLATKFNEDLKDLHQTDPSATAETEPECGSAD